MNVKQLPLPGFDAMVTEGSLSSAVLIYMAHMVLRDEIGEIFSNEIRVLREFGKMNDAQCSQEIYMAQRNVVKALKEVVMALDDMREAQENEGDYNAEK